MWARLSYTSIFERVNVVSASPLGSVPYGALTAVQGAPGPSTTIVLPNATAAGVSPAGMKECHDVGVLNVDGGHPIVIAAPDGKTINGSSTLILPASTGAFAWIFFDVSAQAWFAITATGGGAGPPLTSTTTTPVGFAVTTVDTIAVVSPAVVTVAGQKVLVMFSCEIDSDTAVAHTATFTARVDGGAAIDTFLQTSNTVGSEVVSWHYEVTPAPGSHVYQVNVHADANGIYNLVTGALRLTTVTLPG
jgi:hypothetical protein